MIVTTHALFSSNSRIGSKLIKNGTKHLVSKENACSHVALLVNNRWVHESTMCSGVRVISLEKWLSINTLVDKVYLRDIEYGLIANEYRKIQGKKYDFMGVIYLGLNIALTVLKLPMDKKNRWESRKKYFCCEALGSLTGHYYGMSAPCQILERLLSNGK